MNWVTELRIKNFDGVFSKDTHRNVRPHCGIINLDNSVGRGTHWVCYIESNYFDPFGLPPPNDLHFIKQYNTLQYQEKKSVLCGYFCLYFIKKFQEGYSFYDILYKLLDPFRPDKNEDIIKNYFIKYGNV